MRTVEEAVTIMILRTLVIGLFTFIGLVQVSRAQTTPENTYARPGYPTMTLYVWQPGTSGIWRVERDVDLVELLSATGVAAAGTPGSNQRLVISVFRNIDGNRQQVYKANLTDILRSQQAPPVLQDEDVLMVESRRSRRVSFQIISSVITTASTLVLLLLQLDAI